jgi:hypothetical protein
MKFNLLTRATNYKGEDVARLEKLGFTFKEEKEIPQVFKILNFKQLYTKLQGIPQIEINTLEELMDFVKEYGVIAIDEDSIEIYDDY